MKSNLYYVTLIDIQIFPETKQPQSFSPKDTHNTQNISPAVPRNKQQGTFKFLIFQTPYRKNFQISYQTSLSQKKSLLYPGRF